MSFGLALIQNGTLVTDDYSFVEGAGPAAVEVADGAVDGPDIPGVGVTDTGVEATAEIPAVPNQVIPASAGEGDGGDPLGTGAAVPARPRLDLLLDERGVTGPRHRAAGDELPAGTPDRGDHVLGRRDLRPHAADGSQVISAYDSRWMQHYGGCDGVVVEASAGRSAARRPTAFSPPA